MSAQGLAAYIPEDRRAALARGEDLPARADGSVLFADISGFTPLTESLAQRLGRKRGAEALTRLLNDVYTALIGAVEAQGGSVIGFSGDAITCWFAEPQASRRALAAAVGVQAAMTSFAHAEPAPGVSASLALKCAVATGAVVRCVAGNPAMQRFDVVAGRTVERMAQAESIAHSGEIIADEATLTAAGCPVSEWRTSGEVRYGLAQPPTPPTQTAPAEAAPPNAAEWVHPAVAAALSAGGGRFLAELRPATALFLRFGGIDFETDPAAAERLDAYVRWVQGVLATYEGVLIQLTTGDKGSYLYAAFGAPVAHGDDAVRACAAALDLRSPPPDLTFVSSTQIGISQGLMRVGAYGSPRRCTYGVLGEEVNVAARLMSRAGSGQVLVTDAVARAADNFAFSALGQEQIKGKHEAVSIYALEGQQATPQSPHYARMYAAPLVGRARELGSALAALDHIRAQRGTLLLVEGAAGIGKSHFVAELMRHSGQHVPGAVIALSVAHSTAQQSPYAALRPLLWALLDLPARNLATPEELAARAAAAVRTLDPLSEERFPLLREPLALPLPDSALTAHLDARTRQTALATFVLDLAAAAARRRPLLLVAEDAHWMDEASQQVLLALAQAIALSAGGEQTNVLPAALLLAARPTPDGDSALLDGVRALEGALHLTLDELDATGTETLAAGRLGGLVEPVAAALIHARAQGNPFFAEELIDALRDIGRLEYDGQRWRLSPDTVAALRAAGCLEGDEDSPRLRADASLSEIELDVPGSVQGVVLARLDRLPPAARLALKAASVVGQSFALPLLQAIPALAGIADSLDEAVEQALTRDFVRMEGPQAQIYTFKHNITREVAYGTLLEEQQRELHWAVGAAIEQMTPEAIDLLALHYYRSDTRRPEVRARALHYLSAAAERALHDYANDTAVTQYARAFELEPRPAFLLGQARALHALGRRDDQRRVLESLAQRADAPAFARAAAWGEYAEATGDYDRADAAFAEALAIARAAGDTLQQAQALTRQGMVAWRRGDYQAAEAHFGATLTLLADRDAPLETADAYYGLGLVYRQTGRYDEARAALARELAITRSLGRREREARTLTQMGHVESIERRHVHALAFYQQALAIRKAIGDRPGIGASLLAVAQAYEALGDYGGAEPLLAQALSIQRAIRNRFEEALALNELGILYWLVGDFARALDSLNHGLTLSRAIESEFGEAYVLCNLGQVLRDAGRLGDAIATLQEGLALARAQEDANLEAIYCSDLALAEWMAGNLDAAWAHASDAEQLFSDLEQQASLTAVFATQAQIAAARRDAATARRCVERALAILDSPTGAEADFPHRDYWHCAQVLDSLGDAPRAQACMERARAIVRERAARITSPPMRASYLANVPANRAILAWKPDKQTAAVTRARENKGQ